MSTNKGFDLVLITIGYTKYAIPKSAALQFMDLCAGKDMYRVDSHWNGSESETHAWLLSTEEMPTISLLGPVQFHAAIEARKAHMAEKAKKDK